MLAKALRILRQAGILNPSNRVAVEAHARPNSLARGLAFLAEESILTPEYQALLVAAPEPYIIHESLRILLKAGLLTPEYQALVLANQHPNVMAEVLQYLSQVGMLTPATIDYFQSIVEGWFITKPSIAKALLKLQQAALLSEENKALFFAHPHTYDLASSIIELHYYGLLSQENLTLLLQTQNGGAEDLARTLAYVHQSGILTESCRREIIAHENPWGLLGAVQSLSIQKQLTEPLMRQLLLHPYPNLFSALLPKQAWSEENTALAFKFSRLSKTAGAIFCLSQAGILNEENKRGFLRHPNTKKLSKFLFYLLSAGLLNQENFNLVLAHQTDNAYFNVQFAFWGQVLTQENLDLALGHPHAHTLLVMFSTLHQNSLLTAENRVALINYAGNIDALNDGVQELKRYQCLSQAYLQYLLVNPHPKDLASSLAVMTKSGLSSAENLAWVCAHDKQKILADGLYELFLAKILTHEHVQLLIAASDLHQLVNIMYFLHEEEILTAENLAAVVTKLDGNLLTMMQILYANGILTQENLNILLGTSQPLLLLLMLTSLATSKILTQEHVSTLASLGDWRSIAFMLGLLNKEKILTQAHFNLLLAHPHISKVMAKLHICKIFSPDNFMVFFDPRNPIMLDDKMHDLIWRPYFQSQRLTQANFDKIVQAARAEKPILALCQARDHALVDLAPTAWRAAQELLRRYGARCDIGAELVAMQTWIQALTPGVRNDRVKRCMARILALDVSVLNGAQSMSMQQVLALLHHAIHDELYRQGSLNDAKIALIEALDHLQLGYGRTSPHEIFLGPTPAFNHLLKKCSGLHPDLEFYELTPAGAAQKFTRVAQAETMDYLSALSHPRTARKCMQMLKLFADSKACGNLSLIWPMIAAKVIHRMWELFHPVVDIQALIPQGPSIALPNLYKIEQNLTHLPVYRAAQNLLFFAQYERTDGDAKRIRPS